jgi:phage/plasmid-like protein (TIGR03299 family)
MSNELNLNLTRNDAFAQLGKDVSKTSNAQQAMQAANLAGWDVRKHALQTTTIMGADGEQLLLPVNDKFATVRTNPETLQPEVLGVVGNSYTPIQNEAHCELLDAIVEESGAHFEVAGAMRGGRDVFVCMKLNDQMLVGGIDPLDLKIAAFNSHDGTSSFKIAVTNMRVFCANQQAAVMNSAVSKFSVRHTARSGGILAEAREALKLTFAYNAEFEQAAEKLIQQSYTDAQFNDLINSMWDVSEDAKPAVKTRDAKRNDALNYLFADADTNSNIRGTKWAAYQSITEYVDHYAPTNIGKADSIESARALRVLTGATAFDVKNLAFQKLLVNA